MSSTNQTDRLKLSQFAANDMPKWLSDYNSDMKKIDDFAAEKGKKGGLASLDANGKLVQMPTAEDVGAALSSYVPTGVIFIWSSSAVPDGFLLCDGSEVLREDYNALFSVIGTTYGAGNQSTTFNLPNLVYRVPVGSDNNEQIIGTTGGETT